MHLGVNTAATVKMSTFRPSYAFCSYSSGQAAVFATFIIIIIIFNSAVFNLSQTLSYILFLAPQQEYISLRDQEKTTFYG